MIQNKYARRAAVIGVAVFGYPLLLVTAVLFAVLNAVAAACVSVFEDAKEVRACLGSELPDAMREGWRD